jgi:hypothetical protein
MKPWVEFNNRLREITNAEPNYGTGKLNVTKGARTGWKKFAGALEKTKAAEAILTDPFVCVGIVNVNEHIFFRVAGEITRENFDKLFLFDAIRLQERFTDIEPMGPFTAIES